MNPWQLKREDSNFSGRANWAALAGVSKDTLRYYERAGLLGPPERASNGYRRYSVASLTRVTLIRSALAVGFSVEELAGILAMRKRGDPPCRKVRQLAASKLADIERALSELTAARDQLRDLLTDWDELLAGTAANERAGLLESLSKSGRIAQTRPQFSIAGGRKANRRT